MMRRALRANGYDRANAECARIVAADAERYGPGLATWAERVLQRIEREQAGRAAEHAQQDLFQATGGDDVTTDIR